MIVSELRWCCYVSIVIAAVAAVTVVAVLLLVGVDAVVATAVVVCYNNTVRHQTSRHNSVLRPLYRST
jgi:hypothetical protein